MRILTTLAILLASFIPALGATTWPAGTNTPNQTFYGNNNFLGYLRQGGVDVLTNAAYVTNGYPWGVLYDPAGAATAATNGYPWGYLYLLANGGIGTNITIYGDAARTNSVVINSSGEVLSNAVGGVKITGGTLTITNSTASAPLTVNTNWLVVTNANVGIWTTGPTFPLDIASTTAVNFTGEQIRNDNPSMALGNSASLRFLVNNTSGGLASAQYASVNGVTDSVTAGSRSTALTFSSGNQGAGLREGMRLTGTGNVLINTTNGSNKLSVNGDIGATSLIVTNYFNSPTNTPGDGQLITATGTGGATKWAVASLSNSLPAVLTNQVLTLGYVSAASGAAALNADGSVYFAGGGFQADLVGNVIMRETHMNEGRNNFYLDGSASLASGYLTIGAAGQLGVNGPIGAMTITLTNAPTFQTTNAAPAGYALGVTLPVVWFAITNSGNKYLVPGFTP